MPLLRLVSASVIFWSAAVAWGQPASPAPLSATLKAHLQAERFGLVTSVRGLPLGVREDMQRLFNIGSLDIAEPGAPFQGTGAGGDGELPTRRLIAAGCAADFHCLVYYERGGAAPTWHAMLFRWSPAATRFEWGGRGTRSYATVESVRDAVVSGAIASHGGPW